MKRSQVKTEYKWKTEDIFASDELWEESFEKAEKIADFSRYSGKLSDKNTLLKFFKEDDEFSKLIERLAVYANLRHDEDSSVSKYLAYDAKISSLFSKYAASLAFFESEMAAQSESYLNGILKDKNFSDYDYKIKRIIENKPHVLPENEERLLALAGETFETFRETFSMIDNVNLPLPEITFNGEKVKLTHGVYGIVLHSPDRTAREEAYKKYYAAYIGLLDTIASTYHGNVKKNVFLTKAYKFDSCLSRALFNEDVDKCVYENLLNSVNSNLSAMHRYFADRKKILGYDKLYFYDSYAPLVEGVEFKLSYDEAYEYVIRGLAPLGEKYCALLKRGYDERWIDVEETENKRSGAYSASCYGVHPFVLLNYQPSINEVFTIAHEMGHSLHTYFSSENQPFAKSNYTIFVAEVASTVNEVLLLKYMYEEAKDINLKKYLLNHYLDTIRATLHRQTMFAEFEYQTHSSVENGEPLTKENLCETYKNLGVKYYGNDIEHDYEISCEWARIPHFYRAFYVYKYATGITAAINIAKRILSKEKGALEGYFKFLSGGGSTDPVSLLKYAGVDLTKSQPFEVAMREFEDTLTQFEKLMGI